MAEELKLHRPWLVAVWPGMGNVALSAGYYLMAKLGMHVVAEFQAGDLFDVHHVEVKDGLIQPSRMPRNLLFLWEDSNRQHDIVIFVGEAQPPLGKYAFCKKLMNYAQRLGVERVFTFAAMATHMHPEHACRVFGAATEEEGVAELQRLELELLEDGHIGGLNGVLLGAAAESGLPGSCLLGEMPHIFSHLPFPKASLGVLEVFSTIAGIELDFTELSEQAQAMEQQLGEFLAQVEDRMQLHAPAVQEEYSSEPADEVLLKPEEEKRIEELFEQSDKDRSKAYELKRELDRLNVFKEYEDRFLDLFKKSD